MVRKRLVENVPDFSKDRPNRVDTWFDSNYCAVVSWGGWVRLFSIKDRAFVADLFTHKDSGGVSVEISPDDRHCFLGTYYAWGLACVDITTGQTLWKRDDLKRFLGLAFSRAHQCLFGYFEGKPALRIEPKTGETLETLRAVKYASTNPYNDAVLFGDGRRFTLCRAANEKVWSVGRESFAVLATAWSAETVAISEVGSERSDGTPAGIRCYSLYGELLWRYQARNTHVRPLMFNPTRQQYVGLDFTAGHPDTILVHWDEQTGRIQHEQPLKAELHAEICQQGQKMFCLNSTYDFCLNDIQ